MNEDLDIEYLEFTKSVRKLNDKRTHRIKNSYGIYDGYRYYRKNKPKEKKYILSESQYFAITRKINNILAKELSRGNELILPYNLGKLELRKRLTRVFIGGDGKVKNTLPVDWDSTLKLWYEDKESFRNKTLVRLEEKEVFRIFYNKGTAKYNNKSFFQFEINRDIKRNLTHSIKEGNIDAFVIK